MPVNLDPQLWPLLRLMLHVGFFLAAIYLLHRLLDLDAATELRHLPRPKWSTRPAVILLALAFTGILIHQATWQLTGTSRPEFIAFMQLHDRRELNPAHRIERGRILDRRGVVLAHTEVVGGEVRRRYPGGPAFAHVVGYTHPRYGTSGMEAVATVQLNGGAPRDLGDWRALGRQLVIPDRGPRGRDLQLTLDAELQLRAHALLAGRHGAIVVLRPHDGAILALVSTPAFDPNQITPALFQDDGARSALLNRATQGLYPPGSVFKILPATLALEAGFEGTLDCPADGFTTSARYRKIRDHEYYEAQKKGTTWRGHGRIDLPTALARSSNVFFAQLGVQQGHAALERLGARLRFNDQIVLHESPHGRYAMQTGRLPRLEPADRYGLAQLSIGQGRALVTPAHLALIGAAIANGGRAVQPRLIASEPPVALDVFMSTPVAARLSTLLRGVVTRGTGRGIDDPRLPIAGKTGTAENPHGPSHSWFVGFAPVERPTHAIAVLVEHGGYGSATAAPIARDLLARAVALDSAR